MKNLFLDDIRTPKDVFRYTHNSDYLKFEWNIVRNYDDFVEYIIKNGLPDLISFDHDLADEHYDEAMYNGDLYNNLYDKFKEKTGYDCAKWLIEYCMDNDIDVPKIYVHSMNPIGAENIRKLFINYINQRKKNA